MAEYNVKINVKTDTGYDQLYPKSKSDIIDFDKSNSGLLSENVEDAIKEVNTKANTNKTNIGTLASLKTDSKTNLVGAINEVDSHANTAQSTANTNKTNIGTLSSLKTSVKKSIVNAINWLYDNVVHKTSVIDNLDDIVANQTDGMVAGAKAIAELNGNLTPSSVELIEGVTITRCGRHRVLQINNATSLTAGDIVRLPGGDIPSDYVMGSASYRGQTQGDYFISITPKSSPMPGKVGLFRGNNAATAVDGPYIVAHIDWYV